ncbi:ABC1 kinase family protein [Candidatus Soleaferrea massiliensis]|uniref:ABC1 kinase family protein n=1 Tax=Candidatus Soleaferrea massiliensis TaxID=1470354 RepID=UPI00058D038D|nr:AarF/UbiB family protein [Candidatus Soleaferrea massiliensis]
MNRKKHRPETKTASSSRLRELLAVLRRRDIIHGITPVKLREILEDMGPTYIKLGQVMSMRSDILPQSYCDELVKLQTTVRPAPFEEARQTIEEEYGCPLEKVFSAVDEQPLGSASIAQVYRAELRETGEKVVIKVQRPRIYELMARDVKLMHRAIRILKLVDRTDGVVDFDAVIDEMWAVAQQEMDFLLEAAHCEEFARNNREIRYVCCPKINRALTTSRILVMEQISGTPIDRQETLEKQGYDMEEIGKKLAESFCKQVLDDAFFHADPHPGNLWIRDGRIVFLDLGMMGRLSHRDQTLFRGALKSVVENDVHELKSILLTLGTAKGKVNHTQLYTDIDDMLAKYGDAELSSINLGQFIQELMELAKRHSISMPANISMLARGTVTLEGVLSKCCPNVSLLQIAKAHLAGDVLEQLDLKHTFAKVSKRMYHSASKGVEIPAHLSDLLKMSVKGQTKVNLEIVGSEEPLRKIDRMVNKLITCIIAAALLMGSSIICTTGMQPLVLGIPLLGLAGFLTAMFLCIKLIVSAVWKRKK